MEPSIEIVTKTTLPEQRVRDLLTCGLEGGINYWGSIWEYEFASGCQYADFQEGGQMQIQDNYHHPAELIPFVPGCAVLLVDATEVSRSSETLPDGVEVWRLDRAALMRGLQVMSEKHLRHWQQFIDESEDAETGDVFIQLCLFGEIVYG